MTSSLCLRGLPCLPASVVSAAHILLRASPFPQHYNGPTRVLWTEATVYKAPPRSTPPAHLPSTLCTRIAHLTHTPHTRHYHTTDSATTSYRHVVQHPQAPPHRRASALSHPPPGLERAADGVCLQVDPYKLSMQGNIKQASSMVNRMARRDPALYPLSFILVGIAGVTGYFA